MLIFTHREDARASSVRMFVGGDMLMFPASLHVCRDAVKMIGDAPYMIVK